MPILHDYNQFEGLHWETGTVRNFLAYRGVTAPHTGKPYSEALLLGVSGGLVFGYFSFAYEGYDPHARILTRNTFGPFETMLSRLGITQHRLQTASPAKGITNLVDTLESGVPAIVWADMFSLSYNLLPFDEGMWAMMPILVMGHDEQADQVRIADRSRRPLTVSTGELHAARARVKKDKFRVLTLDPPNPDKLVAAVQAGIWDCIKLYTEKPPRGSKNNFGLAAFQWWTNLLTRPTARLSWEKEFPAGPKMYAGLSSVFADINTFGKDGGAERQTYASFLDEASLILERPALKEAAAQFRKSAAAWERFNQELFPDEIAPFAETRRITLRRHRLFLDEGDAALDEMRTIDARLQALRSQMETDFPLSPDEVVTFRENLAQAVLDIHDIERDAVAALQDAMA